MTRPKGIACAGNWIVDIVHTIDAWPNKSDLVHIRNQVVGVGGGAANVVLDLAAFHADLPLYAVGLLGRDTHGEICRDACRKADVNTQWLASTPQHLTAHTLVMNVPGDSRTFFYNPGTNDALAEDHIPIEAIAAAGVGLFYLGYLNLMGHLDRIDAHGSTGSARLLARAQAAGMTTCVDLVSADTPSFAQTVAAALPHIDYLFLNEIEAQRATGLLISGPKDRMGLLTAAQVLQAAGAKTVIVHTGEVALWLDQTDHWATPAAMNAADIVSPVGAGDAFCAGAIYGIHQGWSPERALDLAHRAAAASLTGATATDGIPSLSQLTA